MQIAKQEYPSASLLVNSSDRVVPHLEHSSISFYKKLLAAKEETLREIQCAQQKGTCQVLAKKPW